MFRFFGNRHASAIRIVAVALAMVVLLPHAASARYVQQGAKLTPPGAIDSPSAGTTVALSADGNTAIVGGPIDDSSKGAAWVYVRVNGAWSGQQKLVATGIGTGIRQGTSVALSADGNTAIVGAVKDNSDKGAAWIWTRSNGLWTIQQKLVSTSSAGIVRQGASVALSADGNTALIGGPNENGGNGAAWVWSRTGNTWQELQKLLATGTGTGDPVGAAAQGTSVALSADGNTAIVGAPFDNQQLGATFVWVRSGNVWFRQGGKLVETGVGGTQLQGTSVALSADGNTALVGGSFYDQGRGAGWVWSRTGSSWSWICGRLVPSGAGQSYNGGAVALSADGTLAVTGGIYDDSSRGAAWVWRREGNGCSQLEKLVGDNASAESYQGNGVAISATGSTILLGGFADNRYVGAAWPFVLGPPHDLSADGRSDIFWRNTGGANALWLMAGPSAASVASLGAVDTSWSPVGQRDFDGDGKADILWRSSGGSNAIWFMNGATVTSVSLISGVAPTWAVVSTADINGDGKGDIIWRNTDGTVAIWLMNGATVSSVAVLGAIGTNWSVAGTADFNGDGKGDILWRDAGGSNAVWFMNGASVASVSLLGGVGTNWTVAGTADFNGDGKGDILWRDAGGNNAVWFMNGATVSSVTLLGSVGTNWSVASNGDYDGDGKGDILWRDAGGSNAIWFMNGATVSSVSLIGGVATNWTVQNAGAN